MVKPQFLLHPLTAIVLSLVYSEMAFAADDQESPTHFAPIVVTAQSADADNGLIIHADPKQPIQPVPATDGADYLKSIMGFNAIKNGGTNGDVTFRGMFGSRIKILTDGTENLGACPARMDAPTSYIQPESFDKITVIKGPQTVQYANTGSAATVIFQREPEHLTSDKPYRGQASVLIGSYGRIDHNVEAALGDETKYVRLNANRSVSNSYKDGDGKKIPSSWERWNADLALGWTPDEDTWVELRAGKSDGEAEYAGRSMDGSQFARESLGLHFEKRNITNVIKKIEGQIDYSYNDHIMDNFSLRTPPMTSMDMGGGHGGHSGHNMSMDMGGHDMGSMAMQVPNKMSMEVTRRTLNSRLAMTTEWDKFSLITGVDSQFNKHGGDMIMYAMPEGNMPFKSDMRFASYGAFGELTYTFNPENKLVTGARADQVKIDNLNTNLSRKETLPSAFIRFENENPEHGLKNYIGLGYVERVPDYWEIMRTNYRVAGTSAFKNLNNEKTLQLDLGSQINHGAWNAWTSVYVGLIDDFILMTYDPKKGSGMSNPTISKNVDATIAGAEAGVGYQFTEHLQADLSAMYAYGENTTDHKALPQIAPLEGRFNVRYVHDKYTLGALWRVVAKQDRISLNQGNIVGYDLGESKAFNTLSLNASYSLTKDVDLAVGIDNVLDKAYTEHLNKAGDAGFGFAASEQFDNIGRNYWARMSMKF
ncbi:TonB-dependent receptor domain-containing protein [Acinetobacter gerneri]|uniref:TonB-dependent receptor domain-containing protein n=1 Tax=Acinetobacter gerneri TaxID=202952 RepID=UPI003A887776